MKQSKQTKTGFSLIQHGMAIIAEVRNAAGMVVAYGSANSEHIGKSQAIKLATQRALAQL